MRAIKGLVTGRGWAVRQSRRAQHPACLGFGEQRRLRRGECRAARPSAGLRRPGGSEAPVSGTGLSRGGHRGGRGLRGKWEDAVGGLKLAHRPQPPAAPPLRL